MKYFLISEKEAIRVKNNTPSYMWAFTSVEASPENLAKLNLIPKNERKPFAVGDRVIVYGCSQGGTDLNGRIMYFIDTCHGYDKFRKATQWVNVSGQKSGAHYTVHSNQIVRLIPKPKPKAVRVTREQLAKLWDDSSTIQAEECPNFDRHCKELGL